MSQDHVDQPERRFPIQALDLMARHRIAVKWKYAEEAYKEYSAKFGAAQTLERLAERGGFSVEEIVWLLFDRIQRSAKGETSYGP